MSNFLIINHAKLKILNFHIILVAFALYPNQVGFLVYLRYSMIHKLSYLGKLMEKHSGNCSHHHAHEPHNHSHDHSHLPGMKGEKRLLWAMILTGSFMVVEIIGGLVSDSLALLSDAFHMLTDLSSLILAWFAIKISKKPSDHKRSYGYHRMEVLAAFINGLSLLVVVGYILFEAFHRIFEPHEVQGNIMLIVSVFGLLVNLVCLKILHHPHEENLNIKGAVIHVIGDLLSSVAAIVAAIVILWSGWMPIDPILSILVSLMVLRSAWVLVKKAGHILLEGAPEKFVVEQLTEFLKSNFEEILGVHHVHIWSLTSNKPVVTMHLSVRKETNQDELLLKAKKALEKEFGIAHSTLQIESELACPDALNENIC